MSKKLYEQLDLGIQTGYVNGAVNSNLAYRPQFVYNDSNKGKKVLSTIENELRSCNEFCISVAFITMGGITPLLQILQELEAKGISGKILTTDYLMFSDPEALERLNSLSNITLKMYRTDVAGIGFHTKGYIFKEEEIYKLIIGSSNLTLSALTKNNEWNTRLVSTEEGEMAKSIVGEFNNLWESEYSYDYDKFIDEYRLKYEQKKLADKLIAKQKEIALQQAVVSLEAYSLKPNSMQVAFINNLNQLREDGAEKALLISATGTGKTYASAFALREADPRKALFIVHREQIAKQAKASYQNVFGNTKSFGLLSGNSKEYESDYLFSTMQMMAKDETLAKFNPDEFDIIVVDEVHRAGASSYQKIMDYFKPQLWLGMTASPERTDGFDVFDLFNHNIAYEIRLQQALEEDLLCPFHYFGITELEIDGEVLDDDAGESFNKLVDDKRVDYILQQANYYGYSGDRVMGLIFCRSNAEAEALSKAFNIRGYFTKALSGDDSQEKREQTIELLTCEVSVDAIKEHKKNVVDRVCVSDQTEFLDYIFTVDIFNEGVDIPDVNQVIMLRPTQSPIVFVQQLGRGLRKNSAKEYVVVLDFIGNYKNNFMIPIALSGDRTYNKDTIRRYVQEGARIIPGSSTIHFDEISRKRIFESIDSANFNDSQLIKDCYTQLKNKLGRIPSLIDFDKHGAIDPIRIFENKNYGSYHKFLSKYEKDDYSIKFTMTQEQVLEYISKKFASGKRVHELLLLKSLLAYKKEVIAILGDTLEREYGMSMTEKTIANVVNVMTNQFATGAGKDTYSDCVFIEMENGDYKISNQFEDMLANQDFFNAVREVVEFGLYRNNRDYGFPYKETPLQLYAKYTYEDVCRLLEWEKNVPGQNIGGYKYDEKTHTYPVFINYDKDDEISASIKYKDRFLSPNELVAISKNKRTTSSPDVYKAINADKLGIKMELFVRKNKKDANTASEFYYLGRMHPVGEGKNFRMEESNDKAVEITYRLENDVREDLFQYFVSKYGYEQSN